MAMSITFQNKNQCLFAVKDETRNSFLRSAGSFPSLLSVLVPWGLPSCHGGFVLVPISPLPCCADLWGGKAPDPQQLLPSLGICGPWKARVMGRKPRGAWG